MPIEMNTEITFSRTLERLRAAQHVVVFTGAGISAESGISTFRDQLTGLWSNYDPAQLATPAAFRRDPELVWGWYAWRRAHMLQAQPNSGHLALVKLAQLLPRMTLITQNVDDLHERAGSQDVIHLHGHLGQSRCFACNRPYLGTLPGRPVADDARLPPPRCLHCKGRVRPDVVWFGESLPEAELRQALQAARNCDLLLSVGTSGVVYPAAKIPELAREHGATVVHLNIESVDATLDEHLLGPASGWLSRLAEGLAIELG